jgi:RHH-type rel operon transcriptional repressor/antitoxin RelB
MLKVSAMLEIRLEPDLDARLDKLAKETGRTKDYYAKEAIKEFLEDREDYMLGVAALRRSEPRTVIAELREEFGLER